MARLWLSLIQRVFSRENLLAVLLCLFLVVLVILTSDYRF
jgi:hypothetical protein